MRCSAVGRSTCMFGIFEICGRYWSGIDSGDVHLAARHRREPRRLFRHDLEDDLLEFCRAPVLIELRTPLVFGAARQHHLVARLPAGEAERSGAVDALHPEVAAERLDVLLVDDGRLEDREVLQQLAERLLELILDGHVVLGADLLDLAHAPGERRLGFLVHDAVDGVDDVLRRELLAAAEGHVVAQVERVGLAVLADGPGFRQQRLDRLQVVVERHQRVAEHVHRHGAGTGARRIVMRRLDVVHHRQRLRLRIRHHADRGRSRQEHSPSSCPPAASLRVRRACS